jgi:hypothetical protein
MERGGDLDRDTFWPTAYSVDGLIPSTHLQCPAPWHRELRENVPVHFVASRGVWHVNLRELVAEELTNHAVFSSRIGLPKNCCGAIRDLNQGRGASTLALRKAQDCPAPC